MSPAFTGSPLPCVIGVTLSSVGAAAGTLTSGTDAGGEAGTSVMSVTLSSVDVAVAPDVVVLPASSSPPQATSIVVRASAASAGARGDRRNIAAGGYGPKVRPGCSGAANCQPRRLGRAERRRRRALHERPQLLGHPPVVAAR